VSRVARVKHDKRGELIVILNNAVPELSQAEYTERRRKLISMIERIDTRRSVLRHRHLRDADCGDNLLIFDALALLLKSELPNTYDVAKELAHDA
jgi:hypothetical protein